MKSEYFMNAIGILTVGTLTAIFVIVVVEAYQHYKTKITKDKKLTESEIMYLHLAKMDVKTFRGNRKKGLI